MRDFLFSSADQPTLAGFNARFGGIADFINNIGNEYIWEKLTVAGTWYVVEGTTKNWTNDFPSDSNNYRTLYKTATAVNGSVVLSDPESVFWTDSIGKYFDLNGVKCKITSREGTTSLEYITLSAQQGTTSTLVGYVNSADPNAYPVNDGYAYKALGQLGSKMQIATGSYNGTGTYGSTNPNSLTFEFAPKMLVIVSLNFFAIVMPKTTSYSNASNAFGTYANSNADRRILYNKISGNTVYWYQDAVKSATGQGNESGHTYHYVAIG